MNLLSLTWPIFIENMLFMLLGFIDIFVLSRYNDVAASAVSAANQVISICNLVFTARCWRRWARRGTSWNTAASIC